MTTSLHSEYGDKTIQEFVHLFNSKQLNLEPGFQRQSVWTTNDRRKLIESIFENCPIPSVFLYRQNNSGRLSYDVIDGKQRLESILMFQGIGRFRGERFDIKAKLDDSDSAGHLEWGRIRRRGHEHRFMGYKIQTVEVSGDFSDIVDLFVRINSTGKRLSSAEKRHAKFFHTPFLKAAGKLAESKIPYFLSHHIMSKGQISRMKHVELTCELLASIHTGGPINKKEALDGIIAGNSLDQRSMSRCSSAFIRTLNLVSRVFPNLRSTRFSNVADFYTIFMLVWEMDTAGFILSDQRRTRQAQKLIGWLSAGVAVVREQVKRAKGATPAQRMFADFLLTVQGATDNVNNRKRRADILKQLLGGLFEKRDDKRGFTKEQRQILWHSDEKRKCTNCGSVLSWTNFTIDHMKAHSKGGRTELKNAKLMCRGCNSKKGNR